MPVIPALRGPRQEDQEFKASMDYIARPYLKKKKKRPRKKKDVLVNDTVNILVPYPFVSLFSST
jgi:hypothetical protein